jgi:hypothetical protein
VFWGVFFKKKMEQEKGLIKRVVFNVCGTRYECSVSVIESKPDTMLAMLLRHKNEGEEEVFIQGDPLMFRWILYYYTSDILVDETTVKVPKEVWDREIEYYTLFSKKEQEEEESKKRPLGVSIDENHELASLAKKYLIETQSKEEEKRQKRFLLYKNILEYSIQRLGENKNARTCYEFLGRSSSQKRFAYPYLYPDSLKDIDFTDLVDHFQEFIEYCDGIGFILTKETYYPSTTTRSNRFAIWKHDVATSHQALYIGLKIKGI